jgi:hypothetical protein
VNIQQTKKRNRYTYWKPNQNQTNKQKKKPEEKEQKIAPKKQPTQLKRRTNGFFNIS